MSKINDEDFKLIEDMFEKRDKKEAIKKENIAVSPEKKTVISNNSKTAQKNLAIIEEARKKSVNKSVVNYKPTAKNLKSSFSGHAMGFLLYLTVIAVIVGGIKVNEKITDMNQAVKIDNAIVKMITPEEIYGDIISYSTYRIDSETIAYDTELLAREILQCQPEYFDLLIYNVYENMQFNKQYNMDNLFHALFCYKEEVKEKNPELYHKLNDIHSFEDYLKKIKCIDEKGEPSIEKFVKYGKCLYDIQEQPLINEYGRKKM